MNVGAARLKRNMKERFKHSSEQEVNPITKPAVIIPNLTPNLGAARNLVVLKGEERVWALSTCWRHHRWQKTLFILLSLCSTYTGVNLVILKRERPSFAPLCPEVYFSGEAEVLLSAGRHINNACFQLALQNSHTVVWGVYRKFEIPDILHKQDDQEGKIPTWITMGQLQPAKSKGNCNKHYQCWN